MITGYTKEAFVKLANGYHTIAKGDNFWNLDKKYGYAPGTIQKYNPGVKPNALRIGGRLRLAPAQQNSAPAPAPQQPVPQRPAPVPQQAVTQQQPVTQQPAPMPMPNQMPAQPQARPTRYQIQPGDNYEKIGGRFGISAGQVGRIEAANPGINKDKLKIGSYINLPEDDKTWLKNNFKRDWDYKTNRMDQDSRIIQMLESSGGLNSQLHHRDKDGLSSYGIYHIRPELYAKALELNPKLKRFKHEHLKDPRVSQHFMKTLYPYITQELVRDPNFKGTNEEATSLERVLRFWHAGKKGMYKSNGDAYMDRYRGLDQTKYKNVIGIDQALNGNDFRMRGWPLLNNGSLVVPTYNSQTKDYNYR